MDKRNTPIVILCGGRGLILDQSGQRRLKCLTPIFEGQPLISFIILSYLQHGFTKFILASGYQHSELKNFFEMYANWNGKNQARAVLFGREFSLSVVYTGIDTTTGDRVEKIKGSLNNVPIFGLTYSDTLSEIDLSEEFEFHKSHGRIGTLAGARMPTRFRILGIRSGEQIVRGFASTPVIQNDLINGGFYFLNSSIFDAEYLNGEPSIVFEEAVLEKLAYNSQLIAYPLPTHVRWHDLDSERSLDSLLSLAKILKG